MEETEMKAGAEPRDPRALDTLAVLESMGISYRYYSHDLALTMDDCAHIGEDAGAQHFKNLFLVNRQGTAFYLVLIMPEKKFRTAEVSKQLGVARLSFATPEQLMAKLGLLPGSVTPMALARESARDVTVAIDRDILSLETVCAHPCVSTASVAMHRAELMRFIARFGNRVEYITVAGE